MVKRKWQSQIGSDKIEVIECLDSGCKTVWAKFEPLDKTKPMEVCNYLVQPSLVSWRLKNSHFETIDSSGKSNYYAASAAGSMLLQSGSIALTKDAGSKAILFPLTLRGSIVVNGNALTGSQFEVIVDKPTWIGYAISGSGTLTKTVNP
jgi:hypothetical protein